MSRESILNLFWNCSFDGMLTTRDFDEKIVDYLPKSFEYELHEGSSKLVFIPKDENYVIKIPYTGDSYTDENDNIIDYTFAHANPESKKFRWDYCLAETLLWRNAKRSKVHHAFAKERILGFINNHPIYIQQRAEVYAESNKYNSASNKERNKTLSCCYKHNVRIFQEEGVSWQSDMLEYYGQNIFLKIMHFIEDFKISDLHESNLGYIDGRPVIIDYSGFLL